MQRYRRLSEALRERFGQSVHKVSLRAGFTCPNRDGLLGTGGCIYCNDSSLIPTTYDPRDAIREQLSKGMEYIRKRYEAEGFIAYFQSNTNTYLPEVWDTHGTEGAGRAVEGLEALFRSALAFPEVKGLAIGTRPDCVQEPILDVLERISRSTYLWMEYGLQSIHEKTLQLINRCHTFETFAGAVHRTKKRGIPVVAHIILGLPEETRDDMLETARALSRLPVDGIKIHSLHAVRGTGLEKWYREGRWTPMTPEGYSSLVVDFLEFLPPTMVVHRLTAESPRSLIVAPEWCGKKSAVLRMIRDTMETRDTYQGRHYDG